MSKVRTDTGPTHRCGGQWMGADPNLFVWSSERCLRNNQEPTFSRPVYAGGGGSAALGLLRFTPVAWKRGEGRQFAERLLHRLLISSLNLLVSYRGVRRR